MKLPVDNGTPLRRLRIWNIQNGFVVTYALWLMVIVLVLWWLR